MLESVQGMRDQMMEGRRTHKTMGTPVPKKIQKTATGDCYVQTGSYMMGSPKKGDVLVHGRPTLQVAPFIEYGHAWIENGDQVMDLAGGYRGDRFLYYTLGKIDYKNNLVYTPAQARQFMASHGHFGPWQGPDGVPMTSSQKASWKAQGKRLPRRTRKSRPAGPQLPPELLKRIMALDKKSAGSEGGGLRVREGEPVQGTLGKPTKAFKAVSRMRNKTLFKKDTSKGRPVKIAV